MSHLAIYNNCKDRPISEIEIHDSDLSVEENKEVFTQKIKRHRHEENDIPQTSKIPLTRSIKIYSKQRQKSLTGNAENIFNSLQDENMETFNGTN